MGHSRQDSFLILFYLVNGFSENMYWFQKVWLLLARVCKLLRGDDYKCVQEEEKQEIGKRAKEV